MADRRRGKAKRQQELTEKPTKVEKAVAKHLRFTLSNKEGKLVGLPVQYFIASDAVNCLLESKWSATKTKSNPLFTNRASCVEFCNLLLLKGMFHRASKVERKSKDKDRDKAKKKKDGDDAKRKKAEEDAKKEKKARKARKDEDSGDKREDSEEEKRKEGGDAEKKEEEKKKRRKEKKVKLEMADNQVFKDGDEIYVWIYDPVPLKTFIIGLLLVLGAIGVCLFPLWPPEVRLGVYYLSLTVAGLIGLLLALCVVRVIIFACVWLLTLGRHHFWFLPNLNEDVGFFDSFKPLYFYEYCGPSSESGAESGGEGAGPGGEGEKEGEEQGEGQQQEGEGLQGEGEGEGAEEETGSELDNDNGYEIVDREDLPEDIDGEEQDSEPEPKKTK